MKKNVKLVKYVLLCAISLGVSSTFLTSCKDYDDDINNLQSQIDANKDAIAKLQTLVGNGQFITGVTKTDDGLVFSLANEGTPITIPAVNGKNGTVVTMGDNGNWFLDDVDSGKPWKGEKGDTGAQGPAGSAGSVGPAGKDGAYYVPNPDGYWHKIDGKVDTKTDQPWLPVGTITAVCDGTYVTLYNVAGYENGIKLPMSPSFVASLSYIPTNIDSKLGEIAFFPVIGTDDDSKLATGKYEYNWNNEALSTTMVNGWCDFAFKVNPSNVAKEYFEAVGFTADSAYVAKTKASTNIPTLNENSKKNFDYIDNVMHVKASAAGYQLINDGNTYDDPDGMKPSPEFQGAVGSEVTYVNTVALQVKNVNASDENAANSLVTSKYVNVKRMVVPQKYTMVGLNTDPSRKKQYAVTQFVDLQPMYAKSTSSADIQKTLAQLPVQLQVPFSGTTELSKYIEGYVTKYFTNTGFEGKESQYLLPKLGFDKPTFKYSKESFKAAEVDQTLRYLKLDENSGDISFDPNITAAILREPVIKVQMYIGKTLVMSKLLKIKVVKDLQEEETFPIDDLKDAVLGCSTYSQTIDFDQIFNHCKYSKEQFVEAYSGNDTWTLLKKVDGKYIALSQAETAASGISVKGAGNNAAILGTALTENNTVTVETAPFTLPGEYAIQLNFKANSSSVQYNPLYVVDYFNITLPTVTASINTTYWANGVAQANVQAPKTAYDPKECIFDTDLNIYFVTNSTTGKAILKYNPTPSVGNYDCAEAEFVFETLAGKTATIVNGKGKAITATVTAKQIKIGNDIIATIDPQVGGIVETDHIELANSDSTKALLNTGKFTIKNVVLKNTLSNGVIDVKVFDIDFVRPLAIDPKAKGAFTDAQDMGDDLAYTDLISMTDWRGYAVAVEGDNKKHEVDLAKFYAVNAWSVCPFYLDTDNKTLLNTEIMTNLKADDEGNWVPDESITTPAAAKVTLPAGTNLTVKVGTDGKYYLNYKTNMGTVKKAYKMWIPVHVGYKWGEVMGTVEVIVNPVVK